MTGFSQLAQLPNFIRLSAYLFNFFQFVNVCVT